jgi:hypothetical protein
MAAKNKQDVEQEIKALASVAEVAFRNVSENIKDIFADALSSGENVLSSLSKDMQRNINSLAKDSNNLIINQSRINKGLITSKDISKQLLNNEDKLYKLEQQRASTIQSINDNIILSETEKLNLIADINKEYSQAIDYNTVLAGKLKEQAEQTQLIEKRTGITAKTLTGLKKIPILGDVLNIDKGLENMKTKALETENVFESMGAGIKGAFEGIEKASVILALVAAAKKIFDFIKDAMFAADERTTKLAKGMMLTKDEATGVYNSLKETKFEIESIYNTTKDVTEAYTDLVNLTDFVTSATDEMVEAQIILTKNIGLSKEEAFGVQEAFAAFNVEANNGKDIVYDQIAAFANQNKLISTGKVIFNDIAKTSKIIQVNFNGNLGALVKSTLEAKKLGLTLDQVSKIGSSLLNFEESISSELEAELLTGKDLNLEKARTYALNHDIAGLAEEISRQGFTQEKFAKYNVIQQEAIAKAYGMSAEEMGDMLYKQKVLEKVGGQTLKNLRERAKATEDINLQNKVAALEQGILSGKSLEEAEKSTSAQEKFNQALEQVKEVLTDLVDGGYLEDFANAIKNMADFLTSSSDEDRKARKQAKEQARQLGENARTPEEKERIEQLQLQSRGSTRGILQKGLSFSINPFYGAYKLFQDDAKIAEAKAAREELGTMAKDQNIDIPVKDFTISTLPEDTVVGMGGTALGRTDEMVKLLTEQNQHLDKQNTLLASINNKEGKIMIGATEIGTGFNVGAIKTL